MLCLHPRPSFGRLARALTKDVFSKCINPFTLLVVLASSTSGDQNFYKSLQCEDHHPIRVGDERQRLLAASPMMTKSRAPAGGNNYPENGLVNPPRRDTRALSPAGMFGGKARLRLAAQKSRPHAPSVPMRSTPVNFLCAQAAAEKEINTATR
jgi:hypothetical protein